MKYVLFLVLVLSLATACNEDDVSDVSTDECASGKKWTGGDEESPLMHPGMDCVGCHTREGEGPRYTFAGTVHPDVNDADDCFGVEGATVRLVDADGKRVTMTTNAAGNFFTTTRLTAPVTATVEKDGDSVNMVTPVTEKDCATCHTMNGAQGAPGRIILPQTR